MNAQLWIEPVGDLIVARVQGVPDEALIRECQERVLALVRETGSNCILYDALEVEAPDVEVVLVQRELDAEIGTPTLRRAIVVPNAQLAYLARLAFGDADYRVFYNDMMAAMLWLHEKG